MSSQSSSTFPSLDADKKRRPSESSTVSTDSRRRSSVTGRALFEGLHTQKRGSFSDPSQAERRNSYKEMHPQAGFFGKLWHGYVTGGPK